MASTIEKQTWLVDTIRRHGRLTLKEIGELWKNENSLNPDGLEMSERTFHRHREEIARIFGLDIKCSKSDYNRYYIDDEVDGKEVRSWMLNTIAIDNVINKSRDLRDRIQFEDIPSGEKYLSTIISAMKDSLKIKMVYRSFWSSEDEAVFLEPYFIKIYKQRWYVIGPSDIHPNDPRTYALDRIVSIQLSDEQFKYPKKFSPKEFFAKDFGIFHSSEHAQLIKIKVAKYQCNYIESLKLHWSQEKIEETPDYNVYSFYLCPQYDFIKHILSNGTDYEVLEPADFRKEIAEQLRAAAEMYK